MICFFLSSCFLCFLLLVSVVVVIIVVVVANKDWALRTSYLSLFWNLLGVP